MDTPVIMTAFRKIILEALIGMGLPLTGLVCRLFKSDSTPVRGTVWADLTEADFTGYAVSAAITWGAAWIDAAGLYHVTGPELQFTATDGAVPNLIYGYAITTSGGSPVLKWAHRFAAPVAIAAADQAVFVIPDFSFPPQQ